MNLVQAATLIAAALTLVAGMPQLLRTVRSSVAGVAGGTWATLTGVGALWTVWAIPSGVWPMVVSEGCFTLCAALIAIRRTTPARALLLASSAAGALYAVWAVGGAGALGVAAGSVGCRGPQVVKAWRAPDVSGVSAGSWALLLAANSCWAVAGVGKHDIVLFLGGFLSALSSVLVIVLAQVRSRRPVLAPDTK